MTQAPDGIVARAVDNLPQPAAFRHNGNEQQSNMEPGAITINLCPRRSPTASGLRWG